MPGRSSSESHRLIGSNSLSSSNILTRHRIVSTKRNMMPCIVFLELCRIMLRLHPRFGIIVVLISNALLNPSSDHIATMQPPLLYTPVDLLGSNPLLN